MRPRSRAWVLLVAHGVLVALGGLFWLTHGRLFDHGLYEAIVGPAWPTILAVAPSVDELVSALVRLLGAFALAFGVLVIAIAMTSFRRGERWAWYAAWVLPIHAAVDLATRLGYEALSAAGIAWDLTLLFLSLVAVVSSASTLEPKSPSVIERGPEHDHAAA